MQELDFSGSDALAFAADEEIDVYDDFRTAWNNWQPDTERLLRRIARQGA